MDIVLGCATPCVVRGVSPSLVAEVPGTPYWLTMRTRRPVSTTWRYKMPKTFCITRTLLSLGQLTTSPHVNKSLLFVRALLLAELLDDGSCDGASYRKRDRQDPESQQLDGSGGMPITPKATTGRSEPEVQQRDDRRRMTRAHRLPKGIERHF